MGSTFAKLLPQLPPFPCPSSGVHVPFSTARSAPVGLSFISLKSRTKSPSTGISGPGFRKNLSSIQDSEEDFAKLQSRPENVVTANLDCCVTVDGGTRIVP